MAYSLFEFVSIMFDKQRYARCTDVDKKQHFFMVMRTMSILFPVEVNNFNIIGINQVAVIDYLHFLACITYKRQPRELSIPTKKSDKEKSKISKFKKEIITTYLRYRQLDMRDFDFLVSINEDFICSELKNIELTIKESSDYFSQV